MIKTNIDKDSQLRLIQVKPEHLKFKDPLSFYLNFLFLWLQFTPWGANHQMRT